MKKENCPFCAHRWIRSSLETPIKCPNCSRKYTVKERPTERIITEEE